MTPSRAVVALLVCLALVACDATQPRSAATTFPADSTMARIERRGVLIVGISFDQPLFGYKDPKTGRITGFDSEIARMVAADITGSERNIQFIEAYARNREEWLRAGVVDVVIATYSITDERRRIVDFTKPYYYAGQDILVRAADPSIQGMRDLAGKKVCTARGSTSINRLRSRLPAARIVSVDGFGECLPALIDGSVDAVSTDDTVLLGLLSRNPDLLRLVGKPFAKEPYGMGVRRGDRVFRDYLNGLIDGYVRDGGWDRAFRKTIGTVGVTARSAKPQPAS